MSKSDVSSDGMEDVEHNIQLAYATFAVFADDGTIDMKELNLLLGMALEDGKITENEKRILNNVFNRIDETHVAPEVWNRIQDVRLQHGL